MTDRPHQDTQDTDPAPQAQDPTRQRTADLLAQVSHELRTPLTAIIGFAEIMAAEELGPHAVPRYKAYAEDIASSGRHLLSVVSDLLDFARLDGGMTPMDPEEIACASLVRHCAAMVRPQAADAKITLDIEVPDGLPAFRAVRRAVTQILVNLLANAVKFTEPGGTVRLTAATAPEGILFCVSDTGIGMSTADLARAMEPYGRVDLAAPRPGSGLGLPLAKAMADAHGLTLSLQSAPGTGTRAQLLIPFGAAAP